MGGLLLPVGRRSMSTWAAHQQRGKPSSEPGTDFYCPIGTPILAPADGRIYGYGTSITPATGRWVGVDFDNGMRFRAMHLSKMKRTSGRVKRGEVIGYSGASGYGEEDWSWNVAGTGGAHVHVTLWPTHATRFGYHWVNGKKKPYTIDFMEHADLNTSAGGGGIEDDMTPEQDRKLTTLYNAMFNGGPSMDDQGRSVSFSLANLTRFADRIDKKLDPINRDGKKVSLRQEIADIKTRQTVQDSALLGMEEALKALASAKGLDPDAILKAAQQGVENGLRNVTFTADVDD